MKRILIFIVVLVCSHAAGAQRIKGTWAAVGDGNASFVIKDSTIYYPDQSTTYKYTLKGDSLRIKYDGFVGSFRFRMRGGDTLVLKGNGEESVYVRFDNAEKVAMIKEFYTRYITDVAGGTDEKKLAVLRKKYCTTKLLNKLPNLIEQADADPFLKGQDSDTGYLKTLTVDKDPGKEGQYVVSYTADHKVVIHLVIVMTNQGYRIDRVW